MSGEVDKWTTVRLAGGGRLEIPGNSDGVDAIIAHHERRRRQWRGRVDHWWTRIIGDKYVVTRTGNPRWAFEVWTFKYRTVKARTAHGGGGGQ